MSHHTPVYPAAAANAVLRGTMLAGALLGAGLGAGCTTLLPVGDNDGIDDSDLQVELGTVAESPADLYVNMASAYLQRGQIDAALTRAKQAVREDRGSARAHYMLAIVYQRIGEREEAETQFQKAVQIDSKNPDYRNAWGVVLCEQQRYKEADKQFQQALDTPLYSNPEVALTNAADCAKRAGDATAAERYWRQALEKNSTFGPALLSMAGHAFAAGNAEQARIYMARYSAVAGNTVRPQALLLAVRIERELGNTATAKQLETSLRQRFPDAPEIMEL
ncbi:MULTISPECIES: type IV pilus biogenesis/stability protein PilW [Thiorhodovibrio]|uniref:type IV pilus biogenesis/stability protein PilW n=1 Tax=Thiorhodovibrio TaxID=61593 RepID=UPI001914C54C|nr:MULTISPECIES: type IV pilus biogenesis/stability protein PilW [Thiorhodovibrio]MBK5967825.1 type IV pilus biogenesis/stability protein PilW [Thiorhodovibrio winogradskyi]WPL14369.1 cellulose synthase subunit BcsC [Thiorhodovibrio litoralis]